MTLALVVLTVLLPLLLALGYLMRGSRHRLLATLPYAALPGLALALVGSDQALELPWLLEGAVWGQDPQRRVFLAFTSLLWSVSGLFARFYFSAVDRPRHFALFWLLTLSGNLGLILAQDIASFYTLFALMTLAAYGLVAHDRTPEAQRAARVYMVMALAGEMALLAGLIIAAAPERLTLLADVPAAVAGSAYRDWIIALLFGGFGVKAGAALLHLWLPLAHPVAPTPASAVLSGAMIKAGLFGWLYTLPLGELALTGWASVVLAAGLLAAFGGAVLGVCQRVPKAVLAYSSISQMGLMTIMLGVGFAAPEGWPAIMAAIVLYAMHHGLAKGALFLSAGAVEHAGTWPRFLVWALVWLPGLSLAGLVLTSGAAAKDAFKTVLHEVSPDLAIAPWLGTMLSLGAIATTLLVLRYLWCLRPLWGKAEPNRSLVLSWVLATLFSLLLFWWLPRPGESVAELATGLAKPLGFLWPPAVGLALAAAALALKLGAPPLPPGDLLVPAAKAWGLIRGAILRSADAAGRLQNRAVGHSRKAGGRLLDYGVGLLEAERPLRARGGLIFIGLLVAGIVILLGSGALKA